MSNQFVYCPICGAPLAEGIKFGRARHYCRYCGFIHFRDPKVAVAALVSDAGRVLLVQRAVPPRSGYWALPAGYMDADEAPEVALLRELAEETALIVRVLRLCRVDPLAGWAEPRGVLLLYRAERVAGEVQPGDDVSAARFFAPGEIPWAALAFESTAQALRGWLAEAETAYQG